MRLVDVLLAFPFYVLVITIVGSLGPGIANLYLAFALVVWISFARIVRAEVLSLAKQPNTSQAARLLGFGHARDHAAPHPAQRDHAGHRLHDVATWCSTILAVTSLGFLGLGIQPPTPEWGLMIAEGRNFICRTAGGSRSFRVSRSSTSASRSPCSATGSTTSCGPRDERRDAGSPLLEVDGRWVALRDGRRAA